MTITEFLLARIAEDEAVARTTTLKESYFPLDWSEPIGAAVGLAGPVDGPAGYESIVIDSARVLASARAKRRIVELAQYSDFYEREAAERIGLVDGNSVDTDGADILRALATVYADHPDFREEWRAADRLA